MKEYDKNKMADELTEVVENSNQLAREFGLEPLDVKYWIVDYDEMNKLIAYDGFQRRYPHWRWGMKYEQQRKKSRYGGGKAFEIVNHDDPCNAFLQVSNSITDQKAVITHVEAHADFFNNNTWFKEQTNAAAMLENHAERIDEIMKQEEVSRDEVEAWIDNLLCLEDNIDPHRPLDRELDNVDEQKIDIDDKVESLDISDEVKTDIFDEEWLEDQKNSDETQRYDEKDLFAFLYEHGKQYDDESGRAVEFEGWQQEIIRMIREEAYYFAPQKMTKTMNEGWAAYWESMMMGDEGFAEAGEVMTYANQQARVLNSPGFNPYKLGKEIWEYIENKANRKEIVRKLLRVEGIEWENFHDEIDFEYVQNFLSERADMDNLVEKHYSLTKPQNTGFIKRISRDELEKISRYLFDVDRYGSIDEALSDVDYEVGWKRMREVRRSHNDVMFIDEFLTQEFVDENEYFTYEYNEDTGQYHVASVDVEDVKKKLLLQFTNFGKPTIKAKDHNYNNRNELLLVHEYNGVQLKVDEAERTLERMFELWGRPVNLKTIVKEKDGESGMLIRYDGEEVERKRLDWEDVEDIAATEVDYDTKPDEWT